MEEITIRGTKAQRNLMEWSQRVADCRSSETRLPGSRSFLRRQTKSSRPQQRSKRIWSPASESATPPWRSTAAPARRSFRRYVRFCAMLSDFTGAEKVYIACGYTDIRKGIDGLAAMVQQEFELDPFTNTLFLFCGRRRDRIKGLYWEGDGFILVYKRLERGVYQWPRNEREAREITPQQYRWLMEGLKVEQPKAHRPVTGLTAI